MNTSPKLTKLTKLLLCASLLAVTSVAGAGINRCVDAQGNVLLTDVIGGAAYVTQADVTQSNGVIHVVNGVLTPKVG